MVVFNMKTTDQSFSNVVVLILLGAVFATGAVAVQEWRNGDSVSFQNSSAPEQQLY
jgi:hypothetical protein